MFSAIINVVNELLIGLSSAAKKNFYNYCMLETAMDNYTIVSGNGYLLSVIQIDGVRDIMSEYSYYTNIINRFSHSISNNFDKKGHVLQSCFNYNPTRSEILIGKALKPSYETAKRLNLDLEYMLDSKMEVLKGDAAEEKNFLLVWTTTSVLTQQEAKRAQKHKTEEIKEISKQIPFGSAGNPFVAHEVIYDKHRAFFETVLAELRRCGVVAEKMTAVEAIREIRMGVDEEYTSTNWQPILPGDTILPTQRKQLPQAEEYDVLPAKLSQQICNKDAYISENNLVKVGKTYFAPIYIDLMPKTIEPFYSFFEKTIRLNIPWRILFTITGDGLAGLSVKHNFAQMLSITSSSNKMINSSIDYLREMAMHNKTIVKYQIALCTWANTKEKALEQVSALSKAVESWGSPTVSEVTGNPISGLASASMGFTTSGIATVSSAPLEDAISMFPLSRPTALWDVGAVIFKSPDGKILPYQPMSSVQATWITLIFAGPGSGKSVLSALTNLGLCLSPGIERLPRISILDIGPTSEGFVRMMQDALPPHQKKFAMYANIQNNIEYAVNPFDTPLCTRAPLSVDRDFLVNLLSLLMTDPNASAPDNGVTQYVGMVIDETYKMFSDSETWTKRNPKRYQRYSSIVVDECLAKLGLEFIAENDINLDNNLVATTWFEIADTLLARGYPYEALLAHRRAMPVLSDLIQVATRSESLKDLYKSFKVGNELIQDAFVRMITSAIQEYPLLSNITTFDLGEAKIVSVNLERVAKSGGAQEERKTAVFYMYAMKLLASDFFLVEDYVSEMPYPSNWKPQSYTNIELCKDYHLKNIKEIRVDKKRLFMDEFHRTSSAEAVRKQVVQYMREGRKWGVEVVLASQSVDDFDDDMNEFATSIMVLSAGKNSIIDKISSKFGINDPAEIDVLKNKLRGPGPNGNIFMVKFDTKNHGTITQLCNNKMGPVEIWATTTNQDDVALKKTLEGAVGSTNARRILSDAFMTGSAANEIVNRQKNRTADISHLNIYQEIASELIKRYGSKYGISREQKFF